MTRTRWGFLLGLLLSLIGLGAYYHFDFQWGDYGTGDWLAYWSIPRGALFGRGYFDAEWLAHIQTVEGYFRQKSEHHPLIFWPLWNPPPIVTLLIPFGALPFDLATLVWIGASALLYAHAALLVNARLPHPMPEAVALAFAFLFFPFLAGMFWGQVTPLLGAFIVYAWLAQRRGAQVAAGLLLVPILLKPHLLFVSVGLLLLVALRRRQWALLGTFGGMTGLLLIIAFALDPHWIEGWTSQGTPVHWQSFSLWDVLKTARGLPGWIQFAGLPLGVLVGLWRYYRVEVVTLRLLGESMILSLLFNPYLWHHDILVALPTALWIGGALWHRRALWLMGLLCLFSLWAMPFDHLSWRFLPYMALFLVLWWWTGRSPLTPGQPGQQASRPPLGPVQS